MEYNRTIKTEKTTKIAGTPIKVRIRILALVMCAAVALFMLTGCSQTSSETDTAEDNAADSSLSKIEAFSTETVNGDEISSADLFAGKDVTMINIWATYCGPCINEMPDLEKLNASLPDNAQIVGVLADVSVKNKGNLQDALDIISDTEVTYDSVLANEGMEALLYASDYVPTTVFVDSEGNVIGRMVIGANISEYVAILSELLDGWSYEG